MIEKINFGCDFISMMRSLAFKGQPNQINPVNEALITLFLLQWGFTVEEVAAANNLFFVKLNSGHFGAPFIETARRIVSHVSASRADQERLVTQMAALGLMDFVVTNEERAFVSIFQQLLNLNPVDFQNLCTQGGAMAVALNNFGKAYMSSAQM
jgi:hypothetical protein